MRKLILFVVLATSLSSCGIFKKSSRDVLKETTESRIEVKKDSVRLVVDKSKVVVKEKVDTVVATKEEVVEQTAFLNMDSLVNGLTAISNDLVDVKIVLDTATNKLTTKVTIKPRLIPIHIDKTTTINKDITTTARVKEAVLVNDKRTTKKVSAKKEPAKMGIWLIGLVLILSALAALVIWMVRKFKVF